MLALPGHLEEEIGKIVASEGLELVHIDYRKQGRGFLLRVDIDKDGGVTLDDCASVSHMLSTWLDVEDAVPTRYDLEVSSPGLDRKFYRTSDYEKFIGRLVRVRVTNPVRGVHVIVGHLERFDGATVVVNDPQAKRDPEYHIELGNITETRLEIEI